MSGSSYLSDVLPTAWQGVKYAVVGPCRSAGCTAAYAAFQAEDDGAIKILLKP